LRRRLLLFLERDARRRRVLEGFTSLIVGMCFLSFLLAEVGVVGR